MKADGEREPLRGDSNRLGELTKVKVRLPKISDRDFKSISSESAGVDGL